jgi:hypothetical protein
MTADISEIKTTLASKLDSIPVASTTTLGGVKVDGDTITINANGVISVKSSSGSSYASGSMRFVNVLDTTSSNITKTTESLGSGISGSMIYKDYSAYYYSEKITQDCFYILFRKGNYLSPATEGVTIHNPGTLTTIRYYYESVSIDNCTSGKLQAGTTLKSDTILMDGVDNYDCYLYLLIYT